METNRPQTNANSQVPADLGLLLVGHGTRDLQGLAEFHELAGLLAQQAGSMPLEACFLELAEPDISSGIDALLARGVQRIIVAPLLLFAAGHAKRDIPNAVAAAVKRQCATGGTTSALQVVCQLPPLGCHKKVLELSALRLAEARPIGLCENVAGEPVPLVKDANESPATTLILVGRGSSDPTASAELHRFAQLRAASMPGVQVEVCFYALAEPRLEPTLSHAARSAAACVIVQPHLLFAGDVQRGVEELTAKVAANTNPRQRWQLSSPLGPHPLLAESLWSMVELAVAELPSEK